MGNIASAGDDFFCAVVHPGGETSRYEYYLGFWGQIRNEEHRWIERDLGIKECDFWFSTGQERDAFKAKLASCARSRNCIIAFAEQEGFFVREKTIAIMIMILPDGRQFSYEHDFGYGYEPRAAEYMFTDGNYGCDCNRSLFLGWNGHSIPEMPCGDEIKLSEFTVVRR